MKTLESFLSENQELVKLVESDASAALNGGVCCLPPIIVRDPVWISPPVHSGPVHPTPVHHGPVCGPVPVSPVHL